MHNMLDVACQGKQSVKVLKKCTVPNAAPTIFRGIPQVQNISLFGKQHECDIKLWLGEKENFVLMPRTQNKRQGGNSTDAKQT